MRLRHPFSRGLALAIALLAFKDISVRTIETRLSGDAAQIQRIPQKLQVLDQAGGLAIAALGNSLVGEGLDVAVFATELESLGHDSPVVARVQADASNIWDWRCVLMRTEHSAFFRADTVIIGYAWDQLTDQAPLRHGSFNNTCSLQALRATASIRGGFSMDEWLLILATKTSKLYAQRSALRHNILGRITPGYGEQTQMLNSNTRARTAAPRSPDTPAFSYRTLSKKLEDFSKAGIPVLLVAMPVQNTYELDPQLCQVLQGTSHQLVDMRHSVPPDRDLWLDGIHLSPKGAQVFSRALAASYHSPVSGRSICAS